jgi:hypothetical protein
VSVVRCDLRVPCGSGSLRTLNQSFTGATELSVASEASHTTACSFTDAAANRTSSCEIKGTSRVPAGKNNPHENLDSVRARAVVVAQFAKPITTRATKEDIETRILRDTSCPWWFTGFYCWTAKMSYYRAVSGLDQKNARMSHCSWSGRVDAACCDAPNSSY